MQKSIVFLFTISKHTQTEIKNTIPFITNQKPEHLGIHLTKYFEELYAANDNVLRKEIKENLIERHVGRLNTVKMSVLPELIYRFIQLLSKFQQSFCRHREAYFKIYMERHKPLNS